MAVADSFLKAITGPLVIAFFGFPVALGAPLFERVPATESGLDFRNLFDEDGPRSFLYQSGLRLRGHRGRRS